MQNRMFVRFTALVIMAMAVLAPVSAQESTPSASPVAAGTGLEGAVAWLQAQQMEDGAFAGFSGEADAGTTVDAIVALVATEQAGIDIGTSVDDAVAYLASGDVALIYQQIGVGQAAKLVLALVAAGENPADFAGTDPLTIVENCHNPETGLYCKGLDMNLYDHAYVLLALSATDSEIPASALDAVAETQAENGGWAFDGATDPAMADSNTTAMLVQALVASGNADHESVAPAMEFLASTVTEDGAAYSIGAEPDGNSTALVLQAMIVAGNDTTTLEAALATFQGESSAFFYQPAEPTDNLFTTVQAVPAMAGVALPVAPATEATPVAARWLEAA